MMTISITPLVSSLLDNQRFACSGSLNSLTTTQIRELRAGESLELCANVPTIYPDDFPQTLLQAIPDLVTGFSFLQVIKRDFNRGERSQRAHQVSRLLQECYRIKQLQVDFHPYRTMPAYAEMMKALPSLPQVQDLSLTFRPWKDAWFGLPFSRPQSYSSSHFAVDASFFEFFSFRPLEKCVLLKNLSIKGVAFVPETFFAHNPYQHLLKSPLESLELEGLFLHQGANRLFRVVDTNQLKELKLTNQIFHLKHFKRDEHLTEPTKVLMDTLDLSPPRHLERLSLINFDLWSAEHTSQRLQNLGQKLPALRHLCIGEQKDFLIDAGAGDLAFTYPTALTIGHSELETLRLSGGLASLAGSLSLDLLPSLTELHLNCYAMRTSAGAAQRVAAVMDVLTSGKFAALEAVNISGMQVREEELERLSTADSQVLPRYVDIGVCQTVGTEELEGIQRGLRPSAPEWLVSLVADALQKSEQRDAQRARAREERERLLAQQAHNPSSGSRGYSLFSSSNYRLTPEPSFGASNSVSAASFSFGGR